MVAMLVVVGIVFGMVYGLSGRRLVQGGPGVFEDAGDGVEVGGVWDGEVEVEVEGKRGKDEQ